MPPPPVCGAPLGTALAAGAEVRVTVGTAVTVVVGLTVEAGLTVEVAAVAEGAGLVADDAVLAAALPDAVADCDTRGEICTGLPADGVALATAVGVETDGTLGPGPLAVQAVTPIATISAAANAAKRTFIPSSMGLLPPERKSGPHIQRSYIATRGMSIAANGAFSIRTLG